MKILPLFFVLFLSFQSMAQHSAKLATFPANERSKPIPFPATNNRVTTVDQTNLQTALQIYCKAFGSGLLSEVSEKIKSIPAYIEQKAIWKSFCKANADGSYEFQTLASAKDDDSNKYINDQVTLAALVKEIGQMRKLAAPSSGDSRRIRGMFDVLLRSVQGTEDLYEKQL